MDTPRYRIGNDLSVFWAIHNRDGSPYNLEGKEVRLFVTHPRGREEVVPVLSTLPDGTINNVIRWDCKGEDQRVLGAYTLTVEILTAEDHKEIKKDICEAFVLVGSSCSECDDEKEINIQDGGVLILSSKLDVYQIGVPKVEIGENGNWFIDGVDTGVSALGGGEGLVNKIYKETDFGGEFDPESVIDTFNAHSINALWLKLKEFAVDSPAVDDVLIYNGSLWVNESFQSLINRYGGTGSGGGGETFWYLGSDGKVHINYDIQIHGNALIEGDAASGGSGEETPAEGTVTSILVNGEPYLPDASGSIDLSEAFKDINVDLTDYYTITETENAIKNALSGYATVEALSPVKTWVDSLKDYITKDESGVHISTNLIIDGDVASGGEGENTPAEGTVTSIEVDGTPYIPNTLGVIDLTDAFKNVTAFLSDYYTKEEINGLGFLTSASLSGYAKETWVNEQIKNIDLSGYATIDELSKYVLLTSASQTITGEVIIDGNLIVKGDVASGGEGEDAPAEGTVTGIRVDANTLLEPTAGIIDMTDVFANLDISDQLENYYTRGEVDAKIAGIDFSPYAKTTDVANTYATKAALATLQSSHNTLRSEFDALNDALNDDVSGKINTWNEIVDFVNEYSGSEDLSTILSGMNAEIAKRAFQSDLTALATRVGTAEGNITSLTNGKADKSELSKYVLLEKASQTIKGDITIEGNLVITGDVASGGEGGNTSAEGTVTGVTVSGVDYTSVEAGLLDLTDLMALYALKSDSTKVSVSPSLSSGKSIGVISVDGVGTTLYAPATYAWSEISEKPNVLLFGGTSSQFLKADGSVDSTSYLPLSGGTITGVVSLNGNHATNVPLNIVTPSMGYTGYIRFGAGASSNELGLLGFSAKGKPAMVYEGTVNTLLHSGNVGEYALKKGAETYRLNIETPLTSNDAEIYAYFQWISADGTNISASDIGSARKGVLRLAGGGSESQLLFDHYNGALYYRNYQTSSWSAWNTLLHSGNIGEYALPLSGGTIKKADNAPLFIEGNVGGSWVGIGFKNDNGTQGFLGAIDGTPVFVNSALSESYTLIHSSNVGDYALKTDGSNYMKGPLVLQDTTDISIVNNMGIFVGRSNKVGGAAFDYASFINIPDRGISQLQLSWHRAYNNLKLVTRIYESNNWSNWKTIAFTDSNVASAQALKHSNGKVAATVTSLGYLELGNLTWLQATNASGDGYIPLIIANTKDQLVLGYGLYDDIYRGKTHQFTVGSAVTQAMLINSSGNVTIGDSDYAGTSAYAKLCIDGVLAMRNTSKSQTSGVLGFSEGDLYLGYSNVSTYNTYISGKNILLSPSGGNVLIGTSTDNGAKLQVNGNISVGNIRDSEILLNRNYYNRFIATQLGGFFAWRVNGEDIDKMVLSTNGDLGIGTTDPSYKLDVAGTGRFTDSLLVSGTLTANSGATITGDVTINGNLIVSGDVASGGTGQDTPSEGSTSTSGVLTLTGEIPEGSNIPQSSLDAIGLTDQTIADLLTGKYHHVLYTSGITTYCFVVSGQYNKDYKAFTLHWGDDYMDEFMGYTFSLGSSGGWDITIYEI